MTNKTLAYLLIAVIVILAGGFVAWQLRANKTVQAPTQQSDATGNQNQKDQAKDGNSNPPMNNSSTTPSSDAACQRDFNENTLKTAKVDIKNRQVEIDVKNFGKITVELYDQDAPKTVENFLRLANAGYYNCVTFHRVAKGFVIQGGDPTGTGSGGDSAFGGKFADELNAETPSYKAGYQKGVLAMANAGPDTNTSQFFIMLGDVPLQHSYTIFGKVVSGLDAVDKIGQVEIQPVMGPDDGSPKVPVVMQSVKIIK
jgi:cyclophilin family peptidyl-prolyl cis-trans isomerase